MKLHEFHTLEDEGVLEMSLAEITPQKASVCFEENRIQPHINTTMVYVAEQTEYLQLEYEVQNLEMETVKMEHVTFTHVPPHAQAVLNDVHVMNISQEDIVEFHEAEVLKINTFRIMEPTYMVQPSIVNAATATEVAVKEHFNENYKIKCKFKDI